MSDKEIILDIMTAAFSESDRMLATLRRGNTKKKIRILATYAYQLCNDFDGVFLSEDKSTAIYYWRKTTFKRSLLNWIRYFVVFLRAIRLGSVFAILKREKVIESRRPDIPDYLYVWVLGSEPGTTSIRGLADIRDHLFGLSDKLQIPILIETTVEKVLKLYKYVGFGIYHQWYDSDADINVWFLERGLKKYA
jgi:hypothetical protein